MMQGQNHYNDRTQRRRGASSHPLFAFLLLTLFVTPLLAQDAAPGANSNALTIDLADPKQLFEKAGIFIWPILACSVVTITFGLERAIALRRGRVIPFFFVRGFMSRLRKKEFTRDSAMEYCERNHSAVATMFLAAVRRWGRPAQEIEQAITETGLREISLLRRRLRTIAASGNVATLLGLLGTVVGMIQAFNAVAVANPSQKATLLAGGIAQALITTALGLCVAIPAVILYNYFSGHVERLVYEMDLLASETVYELAGDSPAADAAPKVHRVNERIS